MNTEAFEVCARIRERPAAGHARQDLVWHVALRWPGDPRRLRRTTAKSANDPQRVGGPAAVCWNEPGAHHFLGRIKNPAPVSDEMIVGAGIIDVAVDGRSALAAEIEIG